MDPIIHVHLCCRLPLERINPLSCIRRGQADREHACVCAFSLVVAARLVHVRSDSFGVIPGISSRDDVTVVFFVYSGHVTIFIDVDMYCRIAYYEGHFVVSLKYICNFHGGFVEN